MQWPDQFILISFGSDVQAVLVVPKFAVAGVAGPARIPGVVRVLDRADVGRGVEAGIDRLRIGRRHRRLVRTVDVTCSASVGVNAELLLAPALNTSVTC